MKHKIIISAIFILGFIYRIVMGLQGVDNVDVGFCNTFYQAIFNAPETNIFNFIYYLTGLIGGAWELIMGQYGLLGFRILDTITLSAAIGFLYLTFRDITPAYILLPATAICFLFPTGIVSFHYDTLSYLLVAASAYCYSRFIKTDKAAAIFAAGIFIGISFFARLVNISFLALSAIPLITVKGPRKSGGVIPSCLCCQA